MKKIKEQQQYINLKQAAELFGIDARTMKKIWLSTEKLHFTRAGRQLLMNKAELINYFAKQDKINY